MEKNNNIPITDVPKSLIKYANLIIELKQEHLIDNWKIGIDEDKKIKLLEQIHALDRNYSIREYLDNASRYLNNTKNDTIITKITSPCTINLDPLHKPQCYENIKNDKEIKKSKKIQENEYTWDTIEKEGIIIAKKCIFVLVAGGIGERLLGEYTGKPIIKLDLYTDSTSNMTFLHTYIRTLCAIQDKYNSNTNDIIDIPLYIMTSDNTHEYIENLLKNNNYYGLKKSQIFLLKQEGVPALINKECKIGIDPLDCYKILTKPHGHGDIHRLLYRIKHYNTTIWKDKKYIIFFQDTNSLTMKSIIPIIGYGHLLKKKIIFCGTKRKPGQSMGILCNSTINNKEYIINIEYNEINKYITNEEIDDDGYSILPGNMNIFCIDIDIYIQLLQNTKGIIGEFINPKYIDNNFINFKKPTRIECMMQDFTKYLKDTINIYNDTIVCILPNWYCYNPIKNSYNNSINLQKNSLPIDSAISSEYYYYRWFRIALSYYIQQNISCYEYYGNIFNINNMPIGPRVIFDPYLSLTFTDIYTTISPYIKFNTPNDCIFIYGKNIIIKNITISGYLYIYVDDSIYVNIDDFNENNSSITLQLYDDDKLYNTNLLHPLVYGYTINPPTSKGFPIYYINSKSLTYNECNTNSYYKPFILNDSNKSRFLRYYLSYSLSTL